MAHDGIHTSLSLLVIAASVAMAVQLDAQALSGDALVTALKRGGYVLVMRHASSPSQPPDAQAADPENTSRERQLDETGRAAAMAMGSAIDALRIPVGEVYTSPTYRARETARLARFADAIPIAELGDRGRSMQAVTAADAGWLVARVKQAPRNTNVLVITHLPNIAAAFPDVKPAPGDGEMLVFHPDGKGGTRLAGRIRIEDWPHLRP